MLLNNPVDVVVFVFDGVDDVAKLLGGTCGEKVDGVANGRAAKELFEQSRASGMIFERRNLHATIGEHVGEHNCGAAGVGDDGAAFAFQFGVHEDGANSSELLTVLAADNASLAEESVDGGVVGGQGTGVA